MDMNDYVGSSFIKLEDVRDAPREETIADCRPGNFDRPDLIFESGNVLSLNKTSVRTLIKAYGRDSGDWVGKVIKCFVGQVPLKDGMTDAVLVESVTPPTADGTLPKPKTSNGNAELNDELPPF